MAESVGIRRSSRVRKLVSYNEDANDMSMHSLKRSAQEAFEETMHSTTGPAASTQVSTQISIKQEASIEHESMDWEPNLAPETIVKQESIEYQATLPPVKRVKQRQVKTEINNDDDTPATKPRARRTTKKTKVVYPHVLVLKPGMVRPPGEKKLPMIYEVLPPAQRKPAINVLALKVEMFSETVRRMRDKIPLLAPGAEETRLKPYVEAPSTRHEASLERANTQRMFILQRKRSVEDQCHAHHADCPVEDFMITGSSGNVYYVSMSHKPACSCPDWLIRKQNCKHILYVLHHVLKVTGPLGHQNAFLTSELKQILAPAPSRPTASVEQEDLNGKRKPLDDECPICCMEFLNDEAIVWCQNSCGNNIHRECFSKWAAMSVNPGHVTCPFCRARWEKESTNQTTFEMPGITMPHFTDHNGYMNVAGQLGYM